MIVDHVYVGEFKELKSLFARNFRYLHCHVYQLMKTVALCCTSRLLAHVPECIRRSCWIYGYWL